MAENMINNEINEELEIIDLNEEEVIEKKSSNVGKTIGTVALCATGVGAGFVLAKKFLKPQVDKAIVKKAHKILKNEKIEEMMKGEFGEKLDELVDAELSSNEIEEEK